MHPEAFAQLALQAIAAHGAAVFSRHGQAQARISEAVRPPDQSKIADREPPPPAQGRKIRFPAQSALRRKPVFPALIQAPTQALRRLRPLARRRLMTARPERVAMRARNPWVRARRIRLGLNVKLMSVSLAEKGCEW